MNELLALFGISAVLAAILANIGIWSPRGIWIKLAAVVAVALFLPVTYVSLTELLSRPKPVSIEWAQRAVPEATVLGSSMVEDQAIYLWLGFAGQDEPRAYTLPWNENLAKQLHKAQQEADAEGTSVKVRQPFDGSIDQMERVFYAEPQTPPPAKQVSQEQGALVFKGSDTSN